MSGIRLQYSNVSQTWIGSTLWLGDSTLSTECSVPDKVIDIGQSAFNGVSDHITSISANNVLSIYLSAFSGCQKLRKATFPSVTSIGPEAFYNCIALTEITIPSVTSIGSEAFYYCDRLLNITFPLVTSIGSKAFYNCGASKITIPSSVTMIGDDAFGSLRNLLNATINNSFVGKNMFSGCSNLKSITISSSVTSIGANAFKNCTALTNVSLQRTYTQGVSTLSASSFSNTPNVSVDSLRQMCYDGYTKDALATAGFTQSTIDSAYGGISLTIVNNAITGATDILSVSSKFAVIPNYVTSITSTAFQSVSSIITGVIFGNSPTLNNINSSAFINCNKLTSIIIPSSVTSIGANAFSNCTALTNVSLQRTYTQGVTILSAGSFTNTPNVSVESLRQMCYDGYVRSNLATAGFTQSTIDSAYGGISLTIVNNAITDATNISSVSSKFAVIPNYVTSITSTAFQSVSSIITGVIFGNSPTLNNINSSAFINCNKLTSIIIPSSVTSIGITAFYGCTSLTNISLQRFGDLGKTTLGNNSFKLTNINGTITTYGISNRFYSQSVATLFSNGYTYNELVAAGFDSTTLNNYYLNNTLLYNDAFIYFISNKYYINTLDTSIHITDTNTNIEETSLKTNNNNDGTINSVNNFRQFFKLYNNSSLNTHTYTISAKKPLDINYSIFGNSEAGDSQIIARYPLLGTTSRRYKLYGGYTGARGQYNRGTILNCSNTVNITNDVYGGSLEMNYNNKSLRTKNAYNRIGIQDNISTNWDPSYNNILTEGYNPGPTGNYSISINLNTEIVSIPGTQSPRYTYDVSGLFGFTVSKNDVIVTSYEIYGGDTSYVETSNDVAKNQPGSQGTSSYALIHTKIPYAIFKLTDIIDPNNDNTTIYVNTINNGIVIDLNDVDYEFEVGRTFTIIKQGTKPIIFNCEKTKSLPTNNGRGITYNNNNYYKMYKFLNMAIQQTFTITYSLDYNMINHKFVIFYYWLIT